MNVCHEGGSIFMFRESWPSRNEPRSEVAKPVDAGWVDYCRARELAERAAAKKAGSIEARRIHQELAQAYARMIRRADKRFVRRDEDGQFKESDDVGRSLARDQKRDSKTKPKRGEGDKGDR